MNRFFRFFRRNSIVHVAIAWALIAIVPASQAESAARIDKHARKIEKRLAKYRPGALLQIDLRDDTRDPWLSGRALRCNLPAHQLRQQ